MKARPHSRRPVYRLLATGAALLGLGCFAADQDGPTETLTIFVPDADERALGPLKYNGTGSAPGLLVLLPLAINLDGVESNSEALPADPVPRLLERWEYTADYREWTGHVRAGVRWGDGTPVTADDIKFSIELWTDSTVLYEIPRYESITAVDSSTVHVVFQEPVSQTLLSFNWLVIVPKHLVDTLDVGTLFSWPYWVEPVGNGPYRYVRHVPQTMTELAANPEYYGVPPRIPRVVLRYGGNPITELLSGNVDVVETVTPLDAMRLDADPRFEIYHRVSYQQSWVIGWNHRNPLFRDAAVRRAMTMAIDRRELHRVLNFPDDLAIVDVPTLLRHHRQGLVPDPLPYSPDRATQVLAEAGWQDADDDGVLEKDGRPFRFTLSIAEDKSAQALFVQDQLRRVGIDVEIRTLDRRVLSATLVRTFDYDAAIMRTNYVEGFARFQISGFRHPGISALGDSAASTLDPARSDAFMRDLWELTGEEIPVTYLHPRVDYLAAHRRVRGLSHNLQFFPSVEHLWIEEE